MPEFTIVIPHRGNPLGLWATIHSCEEDLRGKGIEANYVIVTNGEELELDAKQCIQFLERAGKLKKHLHSDDALTPPVARQRGAAEADGEFLAFFDNHCLVGRQYFERVLLDMKTRPIDLLHSVTNFYTGDGSHYHYRLRLEYNFWAESAKFPQDPSKPYMLAAGGHGGIIVRRSVWDEVGGYGPESLFNGYGGEEMIFDLKLWRMGKSVWIDPRLVHYHYTGERGYPRHWTDDYYVNLMVSANVIGGEKWLYKLFDSLTTKSHIRMRPALTWIDLLEIAQKRSAEYALEVANKSIRTLDECLVWFRENLVAT